MSTNLQASVSISECGRISPPAESRPATLDLQSLAFADATQDYLVFLQARNLFWDAAIRAEHAEALPAGFEIHAQPGEDKSTEPCVDDSAVDDHVHGPDVLAFSKAATSLFSSVFRPSIYADDDHPSVDPQSSFLELMEPEGELFTYKSTYEGFRSLPVLVLREDETIGDRLLDAELGGYFHYDPNVLKLHHLIEERSFHDLPAEDVLTEQACMNAHAVRIFVETAVSFEGNVSTPMLSYIGDFYCQKTDEWLGSEGWMACSSQTKVTVIDRFMECQSRTSQEKHHATIISRPSEIATLYARGNMIPRVLLHPIPRNTSSNLDALPSPLYNIRETKDSFAMLYTHPDAYSSDSISVYSQESAVHSLFDPPPPISIRRLSSSPSIRVQALVQELGLRFDDWPLDGFQGELSPLTRTPTLVDSMDSRTMNDVEEDVYHEIEVIPGEKAEAEYFLVSNPLFDDEDSQQRKKGLRESIRPVFANVQKTLHRARTTLHQKKLSQSPIGALRYTASLRRRFSSSVRPRRTSTTRPVA